MEPKKPTMSVPKAGAYYYGLARNAAYRAAAAGEIPCVKIGGRLFAVVAAIERQLADAGKPNPGSEPTVHNGKERR